jgi:hypothetical protein
MKLKFSLKLLVLSFLLVLFFTARAYAATPVATSFTATASTAGATLLQLQGSDADGTPLTFAIATGPSHGTLSGLTPSTGYVVYTPTAGYTGADSFTFTVTSGGDTTSTATVGLTVTNAKTRIVDTLVDGAGNPRSGMVTFILTQKATSPGGIIPVSQTVSAVLNGAGQFDVSLYPSAALSPQSYYQLWYTATGSLRRELIGVYGIPATSATSIVLAPYAVTETNLSAQYSFMPLAAMNALVTGLGSPVVSFNSRTGAVTPAANDYTWAQINKATSSLADLTTRSASDLSSGTLAPARLGSLTDTALPYKTSSALADSPLLRYGSGTVGFAAGTPGQPRDDGSANARLLLYPGSGGDYLGAGVESGAMWFNVSGANTYKFYFGGHNTEPEPDPDVVNILGAASFQFNNPTGTYTLDYQNHSVGVPGAFILNTNQSTLRFQTGNTNTNGWDVTDTTFRPFTDNTVDLGDATHRVKDLYVGNIIQSAAKDTNGNNFLVPSATASAVNYFQMKNAASGSGPTLGTVGSDANVDFNLNPKGSGALSLLNYGNKVFQMRPNATAADFAGIGIGVDGRFLQIYTYTGGAQFAFDNNVGLIINNARGVAWINNGNVFNAPTLGINMGAPSVLALTNGSTDGTATGGGTLAAKPTSPAQITSNQNNYNPGTPSLYLRLNTDVSRSITGLVFSTIQVDGQTHVIVNVGSADIVLKHQDASSTAGNRFLNSSGADITLTANQIADVWYDATTARWRVTKRN